MLVRFFSALALVALPMTATWSQSQDPISLETRVKLLESQITVMQSDIVNLDEELELIAPLPGSVEDVANRLNKVEEAVDMLKAVPQPRVVDLSDNVIGTWLGVDNSHGSGGLDFTWSIYLGFDWVGSFFYLTAKFSDPIWAPGPLRGIPHSDRLYGSKEIIYFEGPSCTGNPLLPGTHRIGFLQGEVYWSGRSDSVALLRDGDVLIPVLSGRLRPALSRFTQGVCIPTTRTPTPRMRLARRILNITDAVDFPISVRNY